MKGEGTLGGEWARFITCPTEGWTHHYPGAMDFVLAIKKTETMAFVGKQMYLEITVLSH